MRTDGYTTDGFHDEIFLPDGTPRPEAMPLVERISGLPDGGLQRIQRAAEQELEDTGITFSVGGGEMGAERIFPFDVIPRIVTSREWDRVQAGLQQRIVALNEFIADIYGDRKIIADKIIPEFVIDTAEGYLSACQGIKPPKGVWCHITGTDLVRDATGEFHVLEDNLRCPSGVSYVLENRNVLKRTFPRVFAASGVKSIDDYPSRLLQTLISVAPEGIGDPGVVVLTPGPLNSAYFEHSYLARQMGVELVTGADLAVRDDWLCMRTTSGWQRVETMYRRINDDFLDPLTFREDSALGVPGLMDVYRAGRVTIANAPGTGVADDKVVYAYVPQIIKYYTGEDQLLPNVETYMCHDDAQRSHVLANLDKLVVKAANEAGGYGMLVGPHSTKAEQEEFAELIKARPRNYIAQPTLALSRAPVIVEDHMEGRHVDLRPFILYGDDVWVLPGGLTRVALKKGSLVVNSSQGGGSKDTWVVSI